MKVQVLREAGYDEAMIGLSLSREQDPAKMPEVALRLCKNHAPDSGHLKFLESICVWLDITGSLKFWIQESTYRIGITGQSESTMYTGLKRFFTQANFNRPIPEDTLTRLNLLVEEKRFDDLMNELPVGFIQRKIVTTNYKTLLHILRQRKGHRLEQWQFFRKSVLEQVEHPEFLEAE